MMRRKALIREQRRQALRWPAELTAVRPSEWPAPRDGVEQPLEVWRSRNYLAQVYAAPPFRDRIVRRFTINRVVLGSDGRWESMISWDDLQRCKREAGFGDWYAIEIYPRERDRIDVANMRHLWLLSEPLDIGWFRPRAEGGRT